LGLHEGFLPTVDFFLGGGGVVVVLD